MAAPAGLIVAVLAAAFGYFIFWTRTNDRSRWWRNAATDAGLSSIEVSSFLGLTTNLTGRSGPLHVKLATYQRGRHEHGTRISIGGFRHGSYQLTIRPEGLSTTLEKTFGERELEVGDPAFDSAAYLQGAPALVRAIFDADTRRTMQGLLDGRLPVRSGTEARALKIRAVLTDDVLQVDIPSGLVNSTDEWIPAALAHLVALGHRLVRPDDLAARIADNASREPVDAVRLADLRTLASEYPAHPATRAALVAALGDPDTDICLFAATALGSDGRGKLLELATGEAADRVAAAAVTALGEHLPAEAAIERLRRARSNREPATALACVAAAGLVRTPDGIAALAEVLGSASADLAAAAAGALGAAGLSRPTAEEVGGQSEAVEEALVAALVHDASEVRIAAAESLGRIGTPLAVAPLREATSGRALDGALRRATRQAIAEIQGRVSGASPGQLSLAADGAGQLTLAEEDRAGQLTLSSSAVKTGEQQQVATGDVSGEATDADAARRRAAGAAAARQAGTAGRR